MNSLCVAILVAAIWFFSAALHEMDMANNCARNGDAAAWFHEIKCEVTKK